MQTRIHDSLGHSMAVDVPFGMSVAEIVGYLGLKYGEVRAWIRQPFGAAVEWQLLDPALWRFVRPKLGGVIRFSYRQGKSFLKKVLVVATLVGTIVAPFLPPVAAALVVGGLLLANVGFNLLFPPELPQAGDTEHPEQQAVRRLANVQSDRNPAAKGGYLPIVAGRRRILPPELSDPRYSLDDNRQVIERLFAFHGHHELDGVHVDGAPVEDYAAITVETVPGAGDSPTRTFVDKCVRLENVANRLSAFDLEEMVLVNQASPGKSEPAFTRFTTIGHADLEEIVIRLQLDNIVKSDNAAEDVRTPLRIRFREKGSSGAWHNLPEIHITGHDQGSVLKEIRIRWDWSFGGASESGGFNYEFFQRVPPAGVALSNGNAGDQWQAHSHFVSGSGLRDVSNILGGRQGVRVILDDEFGKTDIEWEIMRGFALVKSDLNSSYQISGKIHSLFLGYLGSNQKYQVPVSQSVFNGAVSVNHAMAVVDQQPCQRPATGLVALKSVDESVQNVTVMARRYVRDWDGTGWNTLTADSRNPATHARQILYDALVQFGVSTSLIDNDAFVAWRQVCIDEGYEVNAVFAGTSLREALATIATAGFAAMSFSDLFTVDWLRDRSADHPKVSFSPMNSEIKIEAIEPELPLAIRVRFQDENDDFEDGETEVNNPFVTTITGQAVREYLGITNKSLARKRAYFDLLQTFYQGRRRATVSSATQASICERGDLVQLITDLVDDDAFGAIISEVIDQSTVVIDQAPGIEATQSFFDDQNVFDASDIFSEGEQSLALIAGPDGTQEIAVSSADLVNGRVTVRFAAVLDDQNIKGAHIVIGPKSRLARRWIVLDVNRQAEERGALTLVPEAPEIIEHLRKFDA